MRRYLFQTLFVFVAAVWTSCDKKNDNNVNPTEDKFKISGTASGDQERPNPVTTNATGTLTGTYSTEDKMLHYTITWSNLSDSASAMHFHGPVTSADSSAGVQVAITDFPQLPSGSVAGMATLTASQEAQLLAGQWYFNIHNRNHPGGEIRGAVVATHD